MAEMWDEVGYGLRMPRRVGSGARGTLPHMSQLPFKAHRRAEDPSTAAVQIHGKIQFEAAMSSYRIAPCPSHNAAPHRQCPHAFSLRPPPPRTPKTSTSSTGGLPARRERTLSMTSYSAVQLPLGARRWCAGTLRDDARKESEGCTAELCCR